MRRLMALCISVLLVCPLVLAQQRSTSKSACVAPSLPFTPGELQDIFKTYNRLYWNGKLPSTTVVWTALPQKPGEDYFGNVEKEDDGRFIIRLDSSRNMQPNVARTTILHEMCHIKTWGEKPDHGARWTADLHRIMLEGAFDDLV